MNNNPQETKAAIRTELEATRTFFHTLLASFSESDFRRKSRNPGWTNREILTEMTFGFIILNALLPMVRLWEHLHKWTSKIFASTLNAFTTPFNSVNASVSIFLCSSQSGARSHRDGISRQFVNGRMIQAGVRLCFQELCYGKFGNRKRSE